MPEYISRDMAKEALYKTAEEYDEYDKCDRIAIIALNNADEILNDIPSADVVEVVRCADCKYDERCMFQSFVRDERVEPYDKSVFFCADGKRMDGGQN